MPCPRIKWLRVQFPFERAWAAEASDAQNTDRALFVVMQVLLKRPFVGVSEARSWSHWLVFVQHLARIAHVS